MLTSSSFAFTIGAARWLHYGSAEKAIQSVGGLFGNFFRKKVSGAQGVSSNIVAPGPPKPDWPALLGVPSAERPSGAPQGQEGTDYPTTDRAIRLVVLAIDGRGGPILLADGVRVAGIPKSPYIGGADLPGEHGRGSSPSAERIVDNCAGDRRQDALGERIGLGEQRPGPVGQRQPCIGQLPHGLGRQDVEDGEALYAVRVVEGHAVGDATAAIVSGDREAPEAESLHDGYHVLGHGSLRVRLMVPSGGRATAAPVAAKVGTDDRKVADKQRRDGAPHQVRLREAVQQEDRRPGPARAHENAGLIRLDLAGCELIHHFGPCSLLGTTDTVCSSSVSPCDGRPLAILKGPAS